MARYSVAQTKTSTAAAGMLAQIRTASTRDARVWEIGVFVSPTAPATGPTIGVIRPTGIGSGYTSQLFQAEDSSAGAAVTNMDSIASTAPTIGSIYMRRVSLPTTVGSGIIWTFPEGIVIPISASLVVWQISAIATTYDMYAVIEE